MSDEISELRLLLTQLNGKMDTAAVKQESIYEIQNERLNALKEKVESEAMTRQSEDRHIKAHADQIVISVETRLDKRLVKVEDDLCDLENKVAVDPDEKKAMDARMTNNASRIDDLERQSIEGKAGRRWIAGGLAGAWLAIVTVGGAWVSTKPWEARAAVIAPSAAAAQHT